MQLVPAAACAVVCIYHTMLIFAHILPFAQVRLYTLEGLLDTDVDFQQTPVAIVRMPSKISSVAWSPDSHGVITVGDYDGAVSQVHVCSGHFLNDIDAHSGRRIWSVKHSRLRPDLCVSASDDRSAKLWAGKGLATCAATIVPSSRAAVCCADFSSSHDSLLALASSDHNIYVYDIRHYGQPLAVLMGHRRPVSYVQLFGSDRLVSASTDGTLACWDLSGVIGSQGGVGEAVQLEDEPQVSPRGTLGTRFDMESQLSKPGLSYYDTSYGSCSNLSQLATVSGQHATPFAQQHLQQQPQQQNGSSHQVHSSTLSARSLFGTQRSSSSRSRARLQSAGSAVISNAGSSGAISYVQTPWKMFSGHTNEKNFVGLAVCPEDGLMACGSETPHVYTYHTSWSQPLASCATDAECTAGRQLPHFVSAVAWQPKAAAQAYGMPALLAAATSAGNIKLLSLTSPQAVSEVGFSAAC